MHAVGDGEWYGLAAFAAGKLTHSEQDSGSVILPEVARAVTRECHVCGVEPLCRAADHPQASIHWICGNGIDMRSAGGIERQSEPSLYSGRIRSISRRGVRHRAAEALGNRLGRALGLIPADKYKVGTWPGGTKSWGSHRVWLEPALSTNTYERDKFALHGGDFPGSNGCVDLTKYMDSYADWFVNYGKDIRLKVKYK